MIKRLKYFVCDSQYLDCQFGNSQSIHGQSTYQNEIPKHWGSLIECRCFEVEFRVDYADELLERRYVGKVTSDYGKAGMEHLCYMTEYETAESCSWAVAFLLRLTVICCIIICERGESFLSDIETIDELLVQFREPKGKYKESFTEILPKAQELFGLKNELDIISLDALLIQAIIYCVFGDEDEPDKMNEETAKKRDSYLLAMGLLKGYYHTKEDGTHYHAPDRHKDYLAHSDYKKISYAKEVLHGIYTKEDVEINSKSTLSTADGRCRKELEKFLSKNRNGQKCLKIGSEKYIKKVELTNKKIEKVLILPEPCYTHDNFPFAVEQGHESSAECTQSFYKTGKQEEFLNEGDNSVSKMKGEVGGHSDDSSKKHKIKFFWIILLVVVMCIIGIVLFYIIQPTSNKPEAKKESESPSAAVDFNKLERTITNEDMADLIADASSSLAVYDESGKYDTDSMCSLIYDRILNNPVFGDMVARGMIEAFSMMDNGDVDKNPWLLEFVKDTDTAMDTKDGSYEAGMRKWLVKSHGKVSTTDEYKEYAHFLCNMIDYFTPMEVRKLKATSYWKLETNDDGIYTRTVKHEEKLARPALILCYRTAGGSEYIIGFFVKNGSFAISDPWKWGLDSFTK